MKKRIEPGTAIFDPIKGRDIIIHDVNMIQKVAHCAVSYIHVSDLGDYTTTDWETEILSFEELNTLIRGEDL